jgi:hypothetical protein
MYTNMRRPAWKNSAQKMELSPSANAATRHNSCRARGGGKNLPAKKVLKFAMLINMYILNFI